MKATIELFKPSIKKPREGQAIIVISGGDVFSGVYEENRFRFLDCKKSFVFNENNVDFWGKKDDLILSIFVYK